MKLKIIVLSLLAGLFMVSPANSQQGEFLRRSLDEVTIFQSDISTPTADYKAIFGKGDPDHTMLKGIERYGYLTVKPGGLTKIISFEQEEQIYFVREGTGILHYGKIQIPVSKNDFVYLPAGIKHGLSNPRESDMEVIVMGFRIPPDSVIKPTPKIMIASSDDIEYQVVGNHPPSTLFKLMLGTINSKRDRLAASYQVNSLFIMDFAPGGTNKPHSHPIEEEIYFVLRGQGDMVAGGNKDAEKRHRTKEGDAFFFPRNTLVGFYNDSTKCIDHPLILAVRSKYPQ